MVKVIQIQINGQGYGSINLGQHGQRSIDGKTRHSYATVVTTTKGYSISVGCNVASNS